MAEVELFTMVLIILMVSLASSSAVALYRRYKRIHKQQNLAAAATENSAIVYTIPTNQPAGQTTSSNSGGITLFPNRTTTLNLRPVSSDLPPSYEDVTKNATPTTTAAGPAVTAS
ncbi:uncharacterized protein LOC129725487 isoform X1 [Wyeomyia smithii]|uniref:uncharacterized protein LOC129725487 isoform X1 n=1 Tax=Wyeomyia smithii TaxID=174621 RepID=UPI002467C6E4|nr:uncharacterized protein LOC129725487 isoform X1 [Wyeomyia smithii]